MDANTNIAQRGLRLLALDDGGIRGLSELVIIEEILYRLKHLEHAASMPKPCDYFDIIGGVGTGGIIALMLGRLRMPIDLAIEKYVEFSKKVYSDIKIFSMGSERFKASTFVSAMEDILQSAEFPADVLMQEENPFCKSFVAALPSANMTPRIFRSYLVKANQGYNCTVVEAARATTASPQFFKSVSIGAGGLNEKFIGAHLGYNNPMNFVLEEAELVFGASQPVACIVSIGAGHPGHISWKSSKLFTSMLMKVLMDISTSCEASVESFVKQYKNLPGIFYRLNVDQGL
ncbi:Nephrocystin-3 [Termitomyces sp. T112]|nr:Nephrocystin-3 [Termitomyces sp. T112]